MGEVLSDPEYIISQKKKYFSPKVKLKQKKLYKIKPHRIYNFIRFPLLIFSRKDILPNTLISNSLFLYNTIQIAIPRLCCGIYQDYWNFEILRTWCINRFFLRKLADKGTIYPYAIKSIK